MKINNKNIPFQGIYQSGMEYFERDFPVTAGTTYNLSADYSKGVARGSVVIPGSFHYTLPGTSNEWIINSNTDILCG